MVERDAVRNRTRMKAMVAALLAFLIPGSARAVSIVPSATTVQEGTMASIDITLDPMGRNVGAYFLLLGTSNAADLAIGGITPVTSATGCSSNVSGFSFEGSCVPPIGGGTMPVVATIDVSGLGAGGQLILIGGNVTDDDTFEDVAFTQTILATVTAAPVPEPAPAVLLAAAGLLPAVRNACRWRR